MGPVLGRKPDIALLALGEVAGVAEADDEDIDRRIDEVNDDTDDAAFVARAGESELGLDFLLATSVAEEA